MKDQRRTQADRSAATRDALVRAARPLFASDGFGGVSAEAIARAAGVTRGAMYHQFADKTEVYAAVLEVIEDEVMERISTGIAEAGHDDIVEIMKVGAKIWLDACAEPAVHKIVLIEAPSVLGWERWREVSMRHGMGMVQALLESAIETGRIRKQPVAPLAHVLIGALDEAAIYLARSDGSAQARQEVDDIIDRLVDAVIAG
ncbi:TetR/AcrR family transcriptional regulator [Aeromicrobium sp. 9AM]|uniref:TetR/AcrR family transcriptional regulator n=1 Tax=Aeromicrobium sp. 9AM TaxID=2653126 RepID=UPI0012F413E1|nr:TetR/AcrR family transcriptional regulator [Aeromicrobium sp. 9AM]VXB78012.1 TetR family transcriptional regulator [Aeromicrobium sp. 9AM]